MRPASPGDNPAARSKNCFVEPAFDNLIQLRLVERPQRRHRLRQQLFPQPKHPCLLVGVDDDLEVIGELFQSGQHIGLEKVQQHTGIVQVFDSRSNRNTK